MTKPTIALFAGDPAGVGPELVARLLADGAAARRANIDLVGSREAIEDGMHVAGERFEFEEGVPQPGRGDFDVPILARGPTLADGGFERGAVTPESGRHMLESLVFCLGLCHARAADAICFAPLNKAALRAGGMDHPDELHWFAETLGFTGTCVELNVLDGLWTSRVTSHVALSEVASLLTREKVAEMTQLITESLRRSGVAQPRIAVCGLNPHNGDGGAYGREEIDVIAPGVELARSRGFPADGPFPADTIFVRATRKEGGRPGPDRDEAPRIRARRDGSGRPANADHHAGAWDRL